MKLRHRFLWVAALVILLAPIGVFAEDIVITNSEKTRLAGELLTDVMDLLMERFVGEEITPEYLYESALRGMMGSLDPYSQYLTTDEVNQLQKSFSGKMYAIGISLESSDKNGPIISNVIKDSPAEKSGLAKGDILLEVNNKEIKGLTLDSVLSIIGESDIVVLKIQRGMETFVKSIEKQEIRILTVASAPFENLIEEAKKRDNDTLRYIIITEFGSETDSEFGETISKLRDQGVKSIVLDLRGNPGGYADSVVKVCNRIVPKGTIMYTVDKQGNKVEIASKLEEAPFEKIVVLIDHATASASEVLASALQDSKAAVLVGEATFGKGVIQSLYPLPVGGALKFTTEEYLRRNGEKIDKIGVIPDITITMPGLITDSVLLDKNNSSETLPLVREVLTYLDYKLAPVSDARVYDSSMIEAVKRFQRDAGIEVNGELDAATLIQLNFALYLVYNETDKPLETAYQILREGM